MNSPATRIEYYWSRTARLWIVLALDSAGNQVGDAEYAANKQRLPAVLDTMCCDHADAVVYKATGC